MHNIGSRRCSWPYLSRDKQRAHSSGILSSPPSESPQEKHKAIKRTQDRNMGLQVRVKISEQTKTPDSERDRNKLCVW